MMNPFSFVSQLNDTMDAINGVFFLGWTISFYNLPRHYLYASVQIMIDHYKKFIQSDGNIQAFNHN